MEERKRRRRRRRKKKKKKKNSGDFVVSLVVVSRAGRLDQDEIERKQRIRRMTRLATRTRVGTCRDVYARKFSVTRSQRVDI